jgi:uncharacterized heparinase superfamily protein
MLRTLPHLRWEQIAYRGLRAAQFRLYRLAPPLAARWTEDGGRAPRIAPQRLALIRAVFDSSFVHLRQPLERYAAQMTDLARGRFTFLNQTIEIGQIEQIDWNRRYASHLWNYHLHYFGYAIWCARACAERGEQQPMQTLQRLVEGWIARARVGASDGWEAYPTALRAVNWLYAYALVADRYPDRGFLERWRASIYRQLDFLRAHLEHHLLANHLLKDVKALVIGGLAWSDEARGGEWLAAGEHLLWRELEEQVLGDGGHYERSPMYHAQAMADFLESYALLRAAGRTGSARAEQAEGRLRQMAGFLEAMTHPDGSLALFNVSANTEETRPRPLLETASRVCGDPGDPVREFPQTGYFVRDSGDGCERIVIDAGPPAVDYNPAHAHCDLLSYELWLAGAPLAVDSGVHGYGGDRFREYARSTRAHNTVMIDGREQSEIWGTFRLARRARVLGAAIAGDEGSWEFRGSYAPYFDAGIAHRRRIRREGPGAYLIEDVIDESTGREVTVESFIHLHPRWSARIEGGAVVCESEARRATITPAAGALVEIERGSYFPDFGIAEESRVIRLKWRLASGEACGYRISSDESAMSQR